MYNRDMNDLKILLVQAVFMDELFSRYKLFKKVFHDSFIKRIC